MEPAGPLVALVSLDFWALVTPMSCVHAGPHSRLLFASLEASHCPSLLTIPNHGVLNTGTHLTSLHKRHAVSKHGHVLTVLLALAATPPWQLCSNDLALEQLC